MVAKFFNMCLCCVLFAQNVLAGPFADKAKLGDLFMSMAPAYALGIAMREKGWEGALQLAESVVSSQLAAEGLKSLELERRPNGHDYKSFPSGHAAAAFSGAAFVHRRYGWKSAVIPYAMSGIVAWQRVEVGAHYWHDVAAGAAISALFTWIFVGEENKIGVDVGSDGIGFRFKAAF
jgi:membrane-associated phospholipid phosphatase